MIKKFIGILLALAVIAVIIVAALHHDKYRSMIFSNPAAMVDDVMETTPFAPVDDASTHVVDSVAVHSTDSLAQ